MGQLLFSPASSIQKKLHKGCIGAHPHVDQLSLIEIPMRKNMYHGCFLVIRPHRLPHIVSIFWKTGSIDLSEIGVLCVIGGRFSDIIKAGPQKLSHGKFCIPVFGNTFLHGLSTPAGRAVAERRALFIIL